MLKPIDQFGNLSSAKDGLKYRCKECVKLDKREYRKRNANKVKQQIREWSKNNPDKSRDGNRKRFKKWYSENKNIHRERCDNWFNQNVGKRSQYCANRRVKLLNATIPLTDDQRKQILLIYEECKRISMETGVQHHVDHIFPLNGGNCSGLHVPWNLQIIPAQENLRKSNKVPLLLLEERH